MPSSDQSRRASTVLEPAESSSPARIVVADDDRIGRELLAEILRSAGHSVDPVEDGQEALERVAQGGVDLVLLDIVMPRLSGIEACRLLKGMTLDSFLPVILVTVKTDTASRVEGLRIGADDYVCKPFDEAELLARVQSMLRIKRLHEQIVLQKARFERLSVHDELTGLYNFRFLHTRLGEEFKRAERYHEPFACILVDIDQLRTVNEIGGRTAGDIAIHRVADAIRKSVREVDVVARYGGEEFLAVLPSTHFAGSVAVAERIWREVTGADFANLASMREIGAEIDPTYEGSPRAMRWSETPRKLSVSIGVALYPSRDVRTKDALIRAAEAALSQAKREGGDRICVFQQQGYIYTPSPLSSVLADQPTAGALRSSVLADQPTAGALRSSVLADHPTAGALRSSAPADGHATGAVDTRPPPSAETRTPGRGKPDSRPPPSSRT